MKNYKGQFDKYEFKGNKNAIWFKNVTDEIREFGYRYMNAYDVPDIIGTLTPDAWFEWRSGRMEFEDIKSPRQIKIIGE